MVITTIMETETIGSNGVAEVSQAKVRISVEDAALMIRSLSRGFEVNGLEWHLCFIDDEAVHGVKDRCCFSSNGGSAWKTLTNGEMAQYLEAKLRRLNIIK